mmetsp:Transcript_22900/g.53586  ORF Transcript_22900/g.53586 Transcript_22900/m.53586 type:complete len:90 (+) Transcript_22900:139-408(+)
MGASARVPCAAMGDMQCADAAPSWPMSLHCMPSQPILPRCAQTAAVQFMPGLHCLKHGSDCVMGLHSTKGTTGDMQCPDRLPLFPMNAH